MNKGGQSIVEFALIATLVILGIVFMGPYMLRSIDAHFKLWDEGVHDSFSEVLTNAPVNAVPDLNLTCTCQPDYSSGCGSADVSLSQCAANELNWNTNCNPQGCDGRPISYCQQSDSCCKSYSAGSCGNVAIPAGGLPSTSCSSLVLPPGTVLPPGATCPSISSSGHCYYGQRVWGTQCSDLPIVCVDDATCKPSCGGGPIYPGSASDCDEPPYNGVPLTQPIPTTFVDVQTSAECATSTYSCSSDTDCTPGSNCSGGFCTCTYCNGSCQQYCNFPYVLDHSTGQCEIQFYVAPVPKCDSSKDEPLGASGPWGSAANPTITRIMGGAVVYSTYCTYTDGCAHAGAGCKHTVNDESFTLCADAGTKLTTAYIISGSGQCGNTAGYTPGAACDISTGY